MTEISLVDRLRELIDDEARSCSMDYGCITPQYIHRLWGGTVAIEEIENGFSLQGVYKEQNILPSLSPSPKAVNKWDWVPHQNMVGGRLSGNACR